MSTVFENYFPHLDQNENIFPLAQKRIFAFLQYDESVKAPLTKGEKMVFFIYKEMMVYEETHRLFG